MPGKMTWFIALLLVFALVPALSFALADDAQASAAHTIEKKTFPHLYCYEEDGQEFADEINLYFVDGSTVPYVSLSEFIPMLTEMYNIVLKCKEDNQVSFEIRKEGQNDGDMVFIVSHPDNNSTLIIQPADDTMTFTNYNSFDQKPGSSALVRFMDIPDPPAATDISGTC